MVIQLDIDGTLDYAPQFFSWLAFALERDRRHKVLIVSSRTTSPENLKITDRELEEMDIVYDKLILSPALADLDLSRVPPDLPLGQRVYIYKLMAAEDNGTEILFDDCGITTALFRRYLPAVKVFRPIR